LISTKARGDAAQHDLEVAKRNLDIATRDLDINVAEMHRLTISDQDLSRRLSEQEQVQLEADTRCKAVEDRCCALQHELNAATTSLEESNSKVAEAERACSQAESEALTLQKRLGDEVERRTESTTLLEQEKRELEARFEEGQTNSTESQARHGSSGAIVQRLESELNAALSQATASEGEKADLSADLDRFKSCEQKFKEELAEFTRAIDLLNAESEVLLEKIDDLKVQKRADDETFTNLRGTVQELESALADSHDHAATSERDKSELILELDSTRERERALDKALALHRDEMAALRTDHLNNSQQLDLLRKEVGSNLPDPEVGINTPQSPSKGNPLNSKREIPGETNVSKNDTTASCVSPHRRSQDPRRDSADAQRGPSDAAETLTKHPTRSTSTALQPKETLPKQPSSPRVIENPVIKASTPPPYIRRPTKETHETNSTPDANRSITQANVPSPSKPDIKAAAGNGDAPDPTLLNKKHARAADCDDQTGSKMSKRARRRKRHRESLGVAASGPE
jgi:hypothetical protein